MKKLLILLAGLLVLSVGSASAFPLWPGVGTSPGTQLEDGNLDYFVDNNGDGVLSIGDDLISAIEFPFLNQLPIAPGAQTYANNLAQDELVALAQIRLIDIDFNNTIDQRDDTWSFGQIDSTTAMVQFYSLGSSINLDLGAGPDKDDAIAAIVDGTHLWDFTVDSNDADNFWIFSPSLGFGADQPGSVSTLSTQTEVGQVHFALNFVPGSGDDIFNSIALDFIQADRANTYNTNIGGTGVTDGLVDMTGRGSILGAGRTTAAGPWSAENPFATSDIDSAINPAVIPEPATISLFGLGLLGVAFISRRRK